MFHFDSSKCFLGQGNLHSSFETNVWVGPFCLAIQKGVGLKIVLSCSSIVRLCKLFNVVGKCFVFSF